MKSYYTYLHCKLSGDPFYVGKGHGSRAFSLKKRSNHHKRIVAKYGILIFVFPCTSEQEALDNEIQQIAQLKYDGYELCNQTDGGEGLVNPSLEVRERLAQAARGNTYRRGKKCSPETCAKISAIQTGKKQSPETCAKRSVSMIGNTSGLGKNIGNKNALGYKHSDETKEKMSAARKGKKMPPFSAEHRAKIGLSKIGNTYNNGRKHTDEAKYNMSQGWKDKS